MSQDKEALEHFFASTPREDIPTSMFSDYDKKPFENCLVTDKPLHMVDFYMIQKLFNKRGECTMEMAISLDAAKGMSSAYSEDSLVAMQNFFTTRHNGNTDLEACSCCDIGKFKEDDFSVAIWCKLGEYVKCPMTLCGACQQELNGSLSKGTRDSDRRFREKYFPGIPHDFEILTPSFI